MSWTEERDERLRDLALNGRSASEIGRDLRVSRNAVIGRASRQGIPLHHAKPRLVWPKKPRKSRANKLTQLMYGGRPPLSRERKPPSLPKSIPIQTKSLRIGLMDLADHHCRWPLDERGPDTLALFCGLPMHTGSYCWCHARMTYRTSEQLRRDAIAEREAATIAAIVCQ